MPLTDLLALQQRMTTLMVEAQSVVTLRMMGMSGLIPTPEGENLRMMEEKTEAMVQAFDAATQAIISGQSPNQIINAAITPVSDRVTLNHKRLTRQPPEW